MQEPDLPHSPPYSACAASRPFVLDVSRLVWRLWSGRHPTGIDRVCLAYLDAFGGSSLALLQWGRHRIVLRARGSDSVFAILAQGTAGLNRRRLGLLLAKAVPCAILAPPQVAGRICLNVGHTGLNEPSLPRWLVRKALRPVYLLHDLIPITHPQFARPGEPEKHALRVTNALNSASGIIVNSADTANQLTHFAQQRRLPVPPLLIAHLGIESLPAGQAVAPHSRPYFLTIGTIEGRKNHLLLLNAWALLRRELGAETPDLIIIGQRGWEAEEVIARLDNEKHKHGRIIELADCPDVELVSWIDNARAVLMPSFVEGYGLPVLEAMARRTPVIASDLEVYHEIAEGVPLLLQPGDAAQWAAAIGDYLSPSPDRERQLTALKHYNPPRWSDHMAGVMAWLERAKGIEPSS